MEHNSLLLGLLAQRKIRLVLNQNEELLPTDIHFQRRRRRPGKELDNLFINFNT